MSTDTIVNQRGVIDVERYEAEGTHIAGRVPSAIAGQLAPFQLSQDEAETTSG